MLKAATVALSEQSDSVILSGAIYEETAALYELFHPAAIAGDDSVTVYFDVDAGLSGEFANRVLNQVLVYYILTLTPTEYQFTAADIKGEQWALERNAHIHSLVTLIPLAGDYNSPEEAIEQILSGTCEYLVLFSDSVNIYDGTYREIGFPVLTYSEDSAVAE